MRCAGRNRYVIPMLANLAACNHSEVVCVLYNLVLLDARQHHGCICVPPRSQ
jgi:hypothetical protein